MEAFLGICVIFGGLALLVSIGFGITFGIGKFKKNPVALKTGKIGSLITLPLLLVAVVGSIAISTSINNQKIEEAKLEKRMDKNFKKESSSVVTFAYTTTLQCEDLAKKIDDGWLDAINNSSSVDDFDVDATISNLVTTNQEDVDSINDDISLMGENITKMEANDTGNYDFDAYNNLYKHTKKLASFVTSPYGSYSDFTSTFNDLHQKVEDDMDSLSD